MEQERKELKDIETAELGLMYGQQIDVLHQSKANIEAIAKELASRKESTPDEIEVIEE